MNSHAKNLDRLEQILRKKPLTGLEIARVMNCSKPAAYARVEALRARGANVYTITERTGGRTGPAAKSFGVR